MLKKTLHSIKTQKHLKITFKCKNFKKRPKKQFETPKTKPFKTQPNFPKTHTTQRKVPLRGHPPAVPLAGAALLAVLREQVLRIRRHVPGHGQGPQAVVLAVLPPRRRGAGYVVHAAHAHPADLLHLPLQQLRARADVRVVLSGLAARAGVLAQAGHHHRAGDNDSAWKKFLNEKLAMIQKYSKR